MSSPIGKGLKDLADLLVSITGSAISNNHKVPPTADSVPTASSSAPATVPILDLGTCETEIFSDFPLNLEAESDPLPSFEVASGILVCLLNLTPPYDDMT